MHGPLPSAAPWGINDVGEWLDKLELDPTVRKLFAKKKIDGHELVKLRPEGLESFGLVLPMPLFSCPAAPVKAVFCMHLFRGSQPCCSLSRPSSR